MWDLGFPGHLTLVWGLPDGGSQERAETNLWPTLHSALTDTVIHVPGH